MAQIPSVVLPRDLYDELRALIQWQFDSPIEFDDHSIGAICEVEGGIWEKAHVTGLALATFDEDMQLVAEDEDGVVYQVVRGA